MSLWIRSQNKMLFELTTWLAVVENKIDNNGKWYIEGGGILGYYDTKERALEILNDIQSKLFNSNRVIVQTKYPCKPEDLYKMKMDFESINITPAIVHDISTSVTPMNQEAIIYEMPEK